MVANIWNVQVAIALILIRYTHQELTCTYDVTYNIKTINRTTDMSLIELQTERELKCPVGVDYGGLDVFSCNSDFSGTIIKQDCLLCGIAILPGSDLKPLCERGQDDPNRHLTCKVCKDTPNSCLNNGTGVCPLSDSYAKDFNCSCPEGFNGTKCENQIIETEERETLVCNCSSDIPQTHNAFCNESRSRPCYTEVRDIGCLCNAQTNRTEKFQKMCSEWTNSSARLEYWKGISITWIFLSLCYTGLS